MTHHWLTTAAAIIAMVVVILCFAYMAAHSIKGTENNDDEDTL